MLVRYLSPHIRKIAVVTRGYKRKSKGLIVVSDGKGNITSVLKGGDEPVQIAKKFPAVVVISDEKRRRGCSYSIEHHKSDIIILDDAYQHRSCRRDIDIVVIDATQPLWNQELLPAGRLREPIKNLHRADIILLSKCEPHRSYEQFALALRAYVDAPVFTTQFIPIALRSFATFDEVTLSEVKRKKIFSFHGIGSPQSFNKTVQLLECEDVGSIQFPDHHTYTQFDVHKILSAYHQSNASLLLTTEKDAMRLEERKHLFDSAPLFYPEMKVEFLQNESEFYHIIDKKILRRKNN